MRARIRLALTALALALCFAAGVTACRRPQLFPEDGLVLGGQRVSRPVLKRGLLAYRMYCWQCHGERGDGHGPAAPGLLPPPRDLRLGFIKFSSVPSGRLPADADFERVIQRGLHGTAMLPWDLPGDDLHAIVQYIKTFSPRWSRERAGIPIALTADPWRGRDAAGNRRGAAVYHGLAQCWTCHPAYGTRAEIFEYTRELQGVGLTGFRPEMYEPVLQPSDYGLRILPPDFTRHPVRSGDSLEDLYRTLAAGVGGTPMPGWHEVLADEDIWAMAHYVRSLAVIRNTTAADTLARRLSEQGPN